MNTKLLCTAIAAGLLAVSSMSGQAQSSKQYAPRQEMHKKGSVSGHAGASGYAPGQKMHQKGSARGEPGASGYAPGHQGMGKGDRY